MSQAYLQNLNPAQLTAVTTIEGPVLVIAGPGTGKTQILAARIAHILSTTDAKPHNILCLTFTEAGVQAMRQRLQKMIGNAAYQVQVHTFHSFSNFVIQTYPEKFPEFTDNPRQLTDLTRIKIIREIIDNLNDDTKWQLKPLHNNYQYQNEIIKGIQHLKREGIVSSQLKIAAHDQLQELKANPQLNRKGEPTQKYQQVIKSTERLTELAEIYQQYQQKLQEKNLYDYEDMIIFLVERLEKDDDLRFDLLEKYLYILVDEYQDTNGAQNQIVKQLGSFDEAPNIFAVGDDDQAIYRFQGANVDNILFFKQQFPAAEIITLTENYRSTQQILDTASVGINQNQQRLSKLYDEINKSLTAANQAGGTKPMIFGAETGAAEIEYVLNQVQNLLQSGTPSAQIAILYRKHADALDLAEAFIKAEVPITLASDQNALTNKRVRQLWNILQLIDYSSDDREQQLIQTLLADFVQQRYQFTQVEVFKVLKWFQEQKKYGSPAVPIYSLIDLITQQDDVAAGIKGFVTQLIEWKTSSANASLVDLLVTILQTTGMIDVLTAADSDLTDLQAINAFYEFIRTNQRIQPDLSLSQLINDVQLLEQNQIIIPISTTQKAETTGVQLLTAHGAKGLEFDYVFIIKTIDGNWGNRRNRETFKWPASLFVDHSEDDEEIDFSNEDERRLFYVAMTRARRGLTITYARQYSEENGIREANYSQFVAELKGDLVEQSGVELTAGELGSDEEQALAPGLDIAALLLQPTPVTNYAQQEREYLKTLLADFRLSASALNEYFECPLKFKFNRLLKVPFPPNATIALGNAVHKALEMLAREQMQQSEIKNPVGLLIDRFTTALQFELLNRADYQQLVNEGGEILTQAYQEHLQNLPVPVAVEYNFHSHQVLLELAEQEPVQLAGKIDRIEWLNQQEGSVKVVDFKTSSPKTENQIRGLTKDGDRNIWRQLVFYKLMSELDANFTVPQGLKRLRVDEVEVSFLKLGRDSKLKQHNFVITADDLEELKQEITLAMKHIRALDFEGSEVFPRCEECEWCQALS